MKTYQEYLERAYQLQLRAMEEKKNCAISITSHPSEGVFVVIVLSDCLDDSEGVFVIQGEYVASDHNEEILDALERVYESIP
jgi:hypothetical protein